MAFNLQGFATLSVSGNTDAPRMFSYLSETDALATIIASGYFDEAVKHFQVNDFIWVVGTDGAAVYKVTAVSPNVTVVLFGTLADGTVTLAKLAAGIAPSHVTKFGGKSSQAGGSATVTITATGVTTSHIAKAFIQSSANAVSIQKITPTANTITVLCSGDPGASVFAWEADIAAS